MKITKFIAAAALTLCATALFAQKTFDELSQITRLNRGVYGLVSMNDGEHYTVNKSGAVIRHSYANENECDTLYQGRCASYTFAPNEDMRMLGDNYRSI